MAKKSIPKSPMQQRVAAQTRRAKPSTVAKATKAAQAALPGMTALGMGLKALNKRKPR